ncbi:transposase [uncultured Gammaproteobacteria bacterium]
MDETFEYFVGIDWGRSHHQICVLDNSGKIKGQRSFEHSGKALAEMCAWLLTFCRNDVGMAAVAIEVPYGPVVETLLDRGFAVFFIHPKQLDRFRDRFSATGAKDDRRDARVAGEAVRTDRAYLRRLTERDPMIIRLSEWQRIYAEVTTECVILTNQLWSHLWRYFPAFLEVASDLTAIWIIELWALIPNPAAASVTSIESVDELIRNYMVRRFNAETLLEKLRQPAPIVASGTVEAAEEHCRLLFERLRLVLAQQKKAERAIDAQLAEWDSVQLSAQSASGAPARPGDIEILRSMPGLGRIGLATFLTEANDLVRKRDYQGLRLRTGAAPVTRQSGKMRLVLRRYACSRPLQNALFHWARVACLNDKVCAARYKSLREKGHSYGRALRTVGDRLLSIACAMLKNGTPYDNGQVEYADN